MMIIAMASISLSMLIISYNCYRVVINPVSLYVAPWMICTLLAGSSLYGIHEPRDTTVFFITIGMIGFTLACLLIHSIRGSRPKPCSGEDMSILSPQARMVLIVINILALLCALGYIAKTLPYLINGFNLAYIKMQWANVDGATLFTTGELLIYSWAIIPIFLVTFVAAACGIASGKPDKTMLVFSALGILATVAVSGGRALLFQFCCIVFISLAISPNKKNLVGQIARLPKYLKFAILFAVVAMVLITQVRSISASTGVLENVFFYFTGPIAYFDQIVHNPSLFGLDDTLLGGTATFGFAFNPINTVGSVLFGNDIWGSEDVITSAVAVNLYLSDDLAGNALCTSLFPFMRDFGYAGLFVGPFLFGFMVSFVWEKSFSESKLPSPWFPACVYLCYCVLFSEWRYQLLFTSSGIVLFLLLALHKRKRKGGDLSRVK